MKKSNLIPTRVGDVTTYFKGVAFKSDDYKPKGHPIIRVSNFTDDSIDTHDIKFLDKSIVSDYLKVMLETGDVIVATVGSWPTNPDSVVGKTIRVPKTANKYLLNQNTVCLRSNGKIDQRYLFYLLRDKKFSNYIVGTARGSANQASITIKSVFDYDFYLPPLPTQERIADILGSLDDKIELNRQMNATLEAMARAIFKSWFVDFDPVHAKMEGRPYPLPAEIMDLFPDNLVDSELGPIPQGWEVSTVERVVETVGGATPSTKNLAYWEDGTHHFATPKDLSSLVTPILTTTERKVADAGLQKISSRLLEKGTLLMSSRAPVGYLAITDIPVCINQGFIAMKCNQTLSTYYLLNWAKHNLEEIKGRASGTTFAEISKKNFRAMEIITPPKNIIDEYDDFASVFYEKITMNLYENQTLESIRNTLLPRLMSGEIDV